MHADYRIPFRGCIIPQSACNSTHNYFAVCMDHAIAHTEPEIAHMEDVIARKEDEIDHVVLMKPAQRLQQPTQRM